MSDDDKALALAPDVKTLARPTSNVLLAARFEVQRNDNIRKVFEEFGDSPDKADAMTEMILDFLFSTIKGDESEIREASRYLVDEYFQLGKSALVISKETGRAVAKISEKDIWQPPMAARENSVTGETRLVPQKPRLRPDLEGFLIRHEFDTVREKKLTDQISNRLATTEFLREKGDPRLASITQTGRSQMIDQLRQELDTLVPGILLGTPRKFCAFFSFAEPSKPEAFVHTSGHTAFARHTVKIQDHQARNFKFDFSHTIRTGLAVAWVRAIADKLAELSHERKEPDPVDFASIYESGVGKFWVAGGENLSALHTVIGPAHLLPVNRSDRTFSLTGPAGHIVLRSFDVKHRVLHDQWQIAASVDYDLWIDWSAIEAVNFVNVPQRTHLAEIV